VDEVVAAGPWWSVGGGGGSGGGAGPKNTTPHPLLRYRTLVVCRQSVGGKVNKKLEAGSL
jgi:hypothetical protein